MYVVNPVLISQGPCTSVFASSRFLSIEIRPVAKKLHRVLPYLPIICMEGTK